MLSLGGLNVAISSVLVMFLKSDVFRGCALERPWSVLGGAPRVVLEVWGAPWVGPGDTECCYFIGFKWFCGMLVFVDVFS